LHFFAPEGLWKLAGGEERSDDPTGGVGKNNGTPAGVREGSIYPSGALAGRYHPKERRAFPAYLRHAMNVPTITGGVVAALLATG
jgi:hypothetical protein